MSRVTLEDRAEYAGVMIFLRAVRLLPQAFLPGASRVMGALAFDIFGYRREVALANLARHLPPGDASLDSGSGARTYTRIGRTSVQNFVMGLVEFARLPMIDQAYIKKHIVITGLANLDRVLRMGRGAVLVTGHFGSWEISGCVLAEMGYPVDLLVGVQRNLLVQDLMNDIRRSSGVGVIEPTRLLRAVRSLKANRFVAMLSDQDAGRGGVFVDFLGEQASAPRGAAHLSILANSPIVPGFIVRTSGCGHHIVIEEPILPPESASEQSIRDLTQAYTRVIESYVRRHPGQWLWTHRRWKTRPV